MKDNTQQIQYCTAETTETSLESRRSPRFQRLIFKFLRLFLFFTLAILNSRGRKAFNVVGFLAGGYIAYEILQPYLPRGVFDWKDIYGTIIGGLVALVLLLLMRLAGRYNRVLIRF